MINVEEIENYFDRLFPILRSVTGNGNRETLDIINEIVDLDITEVKAIVFYDLTEDDRVSYLAKNFKNQLIDEFPDFYIYPVYNDN